MAEPDACAAAAGGSASLSGAFVLGKFGLVRRRNNLRFAALDFRVAGIDFVNDVGHGLPAVCIRLAFRLFGHGLQNTVRMNIAFRFDAEFFGVLFGCAYRKILDGVINQIVDQNIVVVFVHFVPQRAYFRCRTYGQKTGFVGNADADGRFGFVRRKSFAGPAADTDGAVIAAKSGVFGFAAFAAARRQKRYMPEQSSFIYHQLFVVILELTDGFRPLVNLVVVLVVQDNFCIR